jgi:hypothetical protein
MMGTGRIVGFWCEKHKRGIGYDECPECVKEEKRYVYGTRSRKWHLVGNKDRDWKYGIRKGEMKAIGKKLAKEKYLKAVLV